MQVRAHLGRHVFLTRNKPCHPGRKPLSSGARAAMRLNTGDWVPRCREERVGHDLCIARSPKHSATRSPFLSAMSRHAARAVARIGSIGDERAGRLSRSQAESTESDSFGGAGAATRRLGLPVRFLPATTILETVRISPQHGRPRAW